MILLQGKGLNKQTNKQILQEYGSKNQADVGISISNSVDFKTKPVKTGRARYSIFIKEKKSSKMTFQFLTSVAQIQGNKLLF